MLLPEQAMMEHLLTKGDVVSSKRLAREFNTSVYEVSGTLRVLQKRGVVKHIRTRKWKVNREVLLELMNEDSHN